MRTLLLLVFLCYHLAYRAQVFVNTDVTLNQGLEIRINDDLLLESSQTLVLDGSLNLNGNAVFDGVFMVNGSFSTNGNLEFVSPGSGSSEGAEVYLIGGDQQISGEPPVFWSLNIGSQGIKTLETDVFTNVLNLDSGRVHTGANKLDVLDSDAQSISYSSGWVSSDFNGQLARNMVSPNEYLFPVGTQQRAFPVIVRPQQVMHPGIRYAGNSAAEDGLSLFQVGDDVCRLRDDAYIRLYNFPASSAEVQFSMIFPADGDYNRIAMRPSIPFETWQIISEGNPLVSDDLITYSVVPPASDPSLVPARIRPTAPIISGPQESCVFDEEIIYTASTFPLTEFVWNIDGGNLNVVSDSTVEVEWETLPAGLISVVATDEEGCSSVSVDYQVQIFPLPDAEINVTPPLIAFEGQEYTFFSAGSNEAAIRFYFEDGSEFYESPFKKSFDSPGQYEAFLELISPEGCKDRDSVLITVEEGLILSNVITPNGDGYNDFWEVPASGMLLYNLQISNRWGTIVFETKSSKVNWDGRDSAGNQVPPGTYFFTLEAQSASKNYSKRGSIQVFY